MNLKSVSIVIGIAATLSTGVIGTGRFVAQAQAQDAQQDVQLALLRRDVDVAREAQARQANTLNRVDESTRIMCRLLEKMADERNLCPPKPPRPE